MFTRLFALALLLVLALPAAAQPAEPVFTPGECSFPIPAGATIDCGTLTVAQNRENPASGTIDLAVAIARPEGGTASPDPVVFLQGGPGGAAIMLVGQAYGTFIEPLTAQGRDVIFFDQRGTGISSPALTCPEVDEATTVDLEAVLDAEASRDLYVEAFTACRDRLTAEGADLAAYTSAENAADVADLARALDYDQINLYGGSYGVRLALTVMRDHPEIVRSAVLDSAIPLEINLFAQQAFKTEFAFERVFAACAADEACNAAYPDIRGQFYAAAESLDAAPQSLALTNPLTGETYDAQVTGSDFTGGVFLGLQVPQLIPELPSIISRVNSGDISALTGPLTISLLLGDQISIGKFVSVNCHEEAFADTPADIEAVWAETPAFANFAASAAYGGAETLTDICQVWGAKPFDAFEVEPVTSDIPTLALAGELDPATPTVWTQQVADSLPNSTYVEFPGLTHVVGLAGGCPIEVITAFIADPSQSPDVSCVAEQPGASFIVPQAEGAPAEAVELTAYADETGWATQVPAAWTVAQPGVWVRGETFTDPTALVIAVSANPIDALLETFASTVGSTEPAAAAGEITTDAGTWALYAAEGPTGTLDVAILPTEGGANALVVMSTTAEDRAALLEGVFTPAVEGFSVGQ